MIKILTNYFPLLFFSFITCGVNGQALNDTTPQEWILNLQPRLDFSGSEFNGITPFTAGYRYERLTATAELGANFLLWQKSIFDCNCQFEPTDDIRLHATGNLRFDMIYDRFTDFNLYGEYNNNTGFSAGVELVQNFDNRVAFTGALLFPFSLRSGFIYQLR